MKNHGQQNGYSLIETLITMVVTSVGLLGLAGVQAKSLQTELTVYQQSQAQMLLDDISDRVTANRAARHCYATQANGKNYSLGTDAEKVGECADHLDAGQAEIARVDLLLWDDLLDGVSEQVGEHEAGGLIGARGCINYDNAADTVTITIAWQGELATTASASSCGRDQYGDDRLRRTLTETLRFAQLG